MSNLREAAQQALAVLSDDVRRCNLLLLDKITKDLRAALAEADAVQKFADRVWAFLSERTSSELNTTRAALAEPVQPLTDKDTVIRLAQEAELNAHGLVIDRLARFAALVAAHEREECAKVCEEPGWNAANWCAKAIRSRT